MSNSQQHQQAEPEHKGGRKKLSVKDSGLIFIWLSIACVALDQLTKYLCVNFIEQGTWGIQVLPFFNLVHVYNHGAAFSFLADMGGWQRWFFTAIAAVMTVVFVVLLRHTPRKHVWTCVALALFAGGAAGNLIDRVFLGYVIDFLLFYLKTDTDIYMYPAFNVADIAVCCGAALLVIISLFGKSDKDKEKGTDKSARTAAAQESSAGAQAEKTKDGRQS